MSSLRLTVVAALSFFAALAAPPGCVGQNTAHCNFKPAGYCAESQPGRPYCSVCIAENDGCVDAEPDEGCGAASQASASSSDTSSSAGTLETTTSTSSTTSTSEPTTSTTTVDPTTTSTSTTTVDPTTTTTESTTTTDTTTDTTTTTTTTDTTTTTTTDTTTDTTTGEEKFCGDGQIDEPEVCDGTKLNGNTCANTPPWGGGTLKCSPTCDFFDYSACCLGQGTKCEQLNDKCCPGLKCKADGLLMYACKP